MPDAQRRLDEREAGVGCVCRATWCGYNLRPEWWDDVWCCCFFFSSRRRHTRLQGDWSSDVCSSDLGEDLLFLDHENTKLGEEDKRLYQALNLPHGAFDSVAIYAPPRKGDPNAGPDVDRKSVV